MAEWLRPGLWEVLTIKLHGIEPGRILAHKKSIGWADGTEVTPRRYYGWHRPHFLSFFPFLDFDNNNGRIDFLDPSIIITNFSWLTSHGTKLHR